MASLINPFWSGLPDWNDISGASYDSVFLDSSTELIGQGQLVAFNGDGSKVYAGTRNSDIVYQYSLSTPYDLSSESYDSKSHDFTAQEASLRGLRWGDSGDKCYIIGATADTIFEYDAGTAYDISTM